MAIRTNAIFDKVVLTRSYSAGQLNVSVYDGDTGTGYLTTDNTTGKYDTTSAEFQRVLTAIQEGAAEVIYNFGSYYPNGTNYTPETLPSYLQSFAEENPFSQASLQVSTTPVTNNRIRFKNVPAHPDGEVVVYEHPNVNYPDEGALNSGLLQEGWWQHLALAQASGDLSTTIVIEMDTTETMTPILNAAGQITGYGFTVVINSIDSDAIRYSDDDGETWTVARPANPTHYAKILPDGSWVEHPINPAPVTVAASGALHVDKGGVWSTYQTHISRGWDISDVPESETHRYEIRATILENWTTRQIVADQNIVFSPANIPLVTPYEFATGTTDYEQWYAHISKQDGHIRQGLSRTGGFHDSAEYNRVTFGKVSFPEFDVLGYDGNTSGRQFLPISSADGLDVGDTIFLTASDGTKEQCRFVTIAYPGLNQPDGTSSDLVEVERGINGTSMMTEAQENTATGTGIIDQRGVARFILFYSDGANEYPIVYRLNVVKR